MDHIIGLKIVVVLPDEHLPHTITQAHSIVLLFIVLLNRTVLAVANIELFEHIEERHVEHVRIHLGVLHASARSRLQAH